MSKRKVLILVAVLLVPALAFLFLKQFGQNRYLLPVYFHKQLDSVQVNGSWKYDTVYHQIPEFSFTAQTGQEITSQELQNNIYVANFFFATCPGICKKMSSQMVRVQDSFRNNNEVKLVSFTVNPEHDSVEVLQQYADSYNADNSKWYFLTGPRKQIYDLAQYGFFLPVQEVPGQNDFIHSEKFMLVDKDRRVRGIYDGTNAEEVDRLITEIRVLLHEYKSTN